MEIAEEIIIKNIKKALLQLHKQMDDCHSYEYSKLNSIHVDFMRKVEKIISEYGYITEESINGFCTER